MSDKKFPKSNLPIRKSVELLPVVFQTDANDKFLSGVLDPLVQPGVLDKVVGYIGRRYDKTYNGNDVYVDSDKTLRSQYQLEPGVAYRNNNTVENFYDYLDFKNQIKFFGNNDDRDDKITSQSHYSWTPPVDWDKFINYREYYWEPSGPPSIPVYGQAANITSTYKVVLGTTKNSFIFTPDAYTNNPTITLYRGQTYKFKVNVPGEGFFIKTNYDSGSLLFRPFTEYNAGDLAVYDSKLWRANKNISISDGSSIAIDSQDWDYVEPAAIADSLIYTAGVTNSGIENGTVTFTVPYDSPDVLYYQGGITPECFGRFIVSDIEENTVINIDKDIIGKSTYLSSNGIDFSNGMVVEFLGTVSPSKYSTDTWLVEGVGEAITLTRFSDLVVPVLTSNDIEVLFDNTGFDTQPFDDAAAYPTYKDYITISRDSIDSNPWSRYNRWFHRSVLEKSYTLRGQDFLADEASRAKRPIIEFESNLQLFNHGAVAKQTVDYIDTNTTDIFSVIEGSTGYNIDGEFLFEGARVLVVADTDSLTNNKIYEVTFITHNNKKQIHLKAPADSESILNECVLVRRGTINTGKMFHFDGSNWLESQGKTKVNQPPLFDAFDSLGTSFSDSNTYPTSTFAGTKIISYKVGNGRVDTELGFSLSYLNINNVGDIQFNWDWETDEFYYTTNRTPQTKKLLTGFYKFNPNSEYGNGWVETINTYQQPIIDSTVLTSATNTVKFSTVEWDNLTEEPIINFYVNGIRYTGNVTRSSGTFTFATTFKISDVISLKIIVDTIPDQGFYEIPVGLEKNPLNDTLTSFTLGQATDHVISALEFNTGLTGIIPGNSNLRDISGYQPYAKRFLKHSGSVPLAMMALCDKTHNVIKSIQHAKKSYTDFKNNFLSRAFEIEYNDNIVNFVDDIIVSLTKAKTENSSFSDSDMIGAGAYTSIIYEVDDPGINTFSLTEKFDLNTLSRNAVYVYVNDQHLLNSRDYSFDSTFGFVKILIDLSRGDQIEIREYISTATNHIPPTPTSMGLYKKYTPMKFTDDTYAVPRDVIQGHDGSITTAYGDFRDDLILELEYRIYNNIKQEYNEDVFDIDQILSGYNGIGLYKKSQLDEIVNQEFLKWIQNTNINYTLNEYFDTENSFTYTYSNMTDPTRTVNLPGYWRGVYKWFFDTDRPHRCPWEMLGFSEQPTWWEAQYGAAPYTKNNLILWEDLAEGLIRQGNRAGKHARYARKGLLNFIPVDGDGKLISPLESGLAQGFSLINNKGSFVLGDIGPAEYAWRSSSEWPFAVTIALCLMKPFEFITDSFDRSKTVLNILGQSTHTDTGTFPVLNDITNYSVSDLSTGLVKYLISYTKSRGLSPDTLWDKINNLDVVLSHRMSGFVDQQQQKFLLDSKNPSASSSNIYVPPENYDIIFNVSAPISSVAYSGVILEKTEGGWLVNGYDDINPYFNYHQSMPNQRDPLISVGGESENFLNWSENKTFNNGTLVRYSNDFYRALKTHNSGDSFDSSNWKKLGDVPKKNAVEAFRRKTFNTLSVKKLSYGTKFTSIQQVVDFFLGYESYLKSRGFIFDRYDPENQVSQDWLSSSKEFMFWTKQNWEIGSLISISPAAEKINITIPVGVSDNILDGFYDYQILKGDGKPLEPRYINVNRNFQNITVETTNTTDGIYYLKLYYVLKEHVTIFDDRTVFNDIIYDKTTGYRQGRIKVQGFRTVDWDGDYTSPGFLFDNVNIDIWKPWTDYRLGDIVEYKSYKWTSISNQLGSETFNNAFWTRLDLTPSKQLIPNFDYKVNQFADYFEVSSEGIEQSQRDLARHTIGYQTREYLQNLAEDPISQFQLYQGYIREKGTSNSITKVFGKLSRSDSDSIILNEEWAFLLGRLGGTDQLTEIEIELIKNNFELNPQLFLINSAETLIDTDQAYRLTASDFTIAPIPYVTNINPVTTDNLISRSAGYVSLGQCEHTVATRAELTSLDISTVNENDHIWITFDKESWTVLRINENVQLYVTDLTRPTDTTVVLTLNRPHSINVEDYVGIREITNLTGFFKVTEITNETITVEVSADISTPVIDSSSLSYLQLLTECRVDNYQVLDQKLAALYKNKSRIFVDNNGNDLWEVTEKNSLYSVKAPTDYGISSQLNAGSKVVYDNSNRHVISSIPGSGIVTIHVETDSGLTLKQIISPPTGFFAAALGSFGNSISVSPDSKYLIIGAPNSSGVTTNYKETWEADTDYQLDDIVLHQGRLWKAKTAINGTIDSVVNTTEWELATLIPALSSGRNSGKYQQGMIAVYEYINGKYVSTSAFVSPRPANDEKFGSDITVGSDGTNYYMAVSAVGAYNNTGRVYLFKHNGTEWSHLENTLYRGEYDPTESYYAGDIVWQVSQDPIAEGVPGNLWQAQDTQLGDGSTITLESMNWLKVSDISTNCSLPTNISLEDDGSTLEAGLLSNTQLAELIKNGDQFGASLAMNHDASILVVGAPFADGQYFANYKGLWRPDIEYAEGSVVRYKETSAPDTAYQYYKLDDLYLGDSTYRSLNEDPSNSPNWQVVGDSTTTASGKIFVYKRTSFGSYEFKQMINAGSLSSFTDIDSGLVVSTGDQFGFSMDIDSSGDKLVVSSPRADVNYQNQGSVFVFNLNASTTEYRVVQRLESFEIYPNEYFGYGISISPDGSKIAVGARNSENVYNVIFDILSGTTFDNARTSFIENQGYTGAVYVFDLKDQTFFLTEKLEDIFSPNESFGYSVDCVGSKILVGSPNYRIPTIHNTGETTYGVEFVGKVRMFTKDENKSSWNVLTQQTPLVDIRKIKSIELYDNVKNVKIQDVDYVDSIAGKILNIAEQEIKFKTDYDPAVYTIGTDEVVVDPAINWLEKNVGKLWWNTSTAKWIYAEQNDAAYRQGNWNMLAEGASIDVYEWVETSLLPSEWAALADTNEGIAEGISGQPKYPNDDVYSIRQFYSSTTGLVNSTLYYYWVKGKTVVPPNMPDRTRSVSEVASLISNPMGSGVAFIALIDSDKFVSYNFDSVISSSTALLNIKFRNDLKSLVPIHSEYQLLTEGVADSLPAEKLENKWIDSLVGSDTKGNRVPDTKLPAKQKYGVSFRPRQSMFVNRVAALKIAVERINTVLLKEAFADSIDLTYFNLKDEIPSELLNLYDTTVDTEIDLQAVGTTRTKQAVLLANLVNGELDTIEIIDPGFGYKVVPSVEIEGDGSGAAAEVTLDNQGRISSVTVTSRGKKYGVLTAKIRFFSVLVINDSTINNFWSIYAWDNNRKSFFRSQSQAYDTTKYWSYIDWWKSGYGTTSRITKEFNDIYEETKEIVEIGDLIRIKEYGAGGWAVFEKTADTGATFLDRYTIVARKTGTIQIDSSTYDTTQYGIGFDNTRSFDTSEYDIENSKEIRNILTAAKESIFVGSYAAEWNNLFFSSIRYVLAEQNYVDWVFKTSFLNAVHNVGGFDRRMNYKSDSLDSFKDYINEVKPFRTTVREYVSKYSDIESCGSAVADFDLPPTYSTVDGEVVTITSNRSELQKYPWKWWADNNGYSITEIKVYDGGEQYINPPKVVITGNGTGATAQAYVSNGKVSGVLILTAGTGYTTTPVVTLVGGNGSSARTAKAVAILGDSKVRSFDLSVKFDRVSKTGNYQKYNQEQSFTASGSSAVFELDYAPTRDKSKISILKNSQLVLNNEYTLNLYYSSSDSYSLIRGKIVFNETPANGDIITVSYEKNIELLTAVDRIERFYSPVAGMAGKGAQSFVKKIKTSVSNSSLLYLDSTFGLKLGMKAIVDGEIIAAVVEVVSNTAVVVNREITILEATIITFEGYNFNQLMTGIDFGGVQIQGTTFDVTGGWDALPWFTDNWDSVESNSDYYYSVAADDTPDSSQPYLKGSIINFNSKMYHALKDTIENGDIVFPYDDNWENYWELFKVTLPYVPAVGQEINIYVKRNGETTSKRIDDLAFTNQVDSSSSVNPEAQMPTFIGDGVNSDVEIGQYIQLNNGDILIFRPVESDGSVTITDENLLDTRLSGGLLTSSNSTATRTAPNTIDGIYDLARGVTAEEIAITGGKFIEPDHVPAPEENVPGQVLDSVSIKVYQNTVSGSAPLQSKILESNGTTTIYSIGQRVLENNSVFVYVDKVKKIIDADYTLNLKDYTVEFTVAPTEGAVIEILSIGIGGVEILDYQEFNADGTTNLFLTAANYDYTSMIYVTVNGEYIDTGFKNSTDVVDAVGRTLVEFGFNPAAGDVIKIVCLRASSDTDLSNLAVVKVNSQTVYFEGSTRSFDLTNFVELVRGSARNSMIVEVNGRVLQGADTEYTVYDGVTNSFTLGLDPYQAPGTLLTDNIKVFVNNVLQESITDYIFDAPTKVLSIYPTKIVEGDVIKIENNFRSEYSVSNNTLTISSDVAMTVTDETDNVEINITWFSEYPSLDIISDEKSGGKVSYKLSRSPISASYVWVYRNGQRLTQDVDYYISLPRAVVYLNVDTTDNDIIKIISFTASIFRLPSAFEIYKDMLNIHHYNRFSSGEVTLTQPLNYYDTEIFVNDVTLLTDPNPSRNVPGIVYVQGERIEYMIKNQNTLGQLRRGVQGTPIKEVYDVGTSVADVGYQNFIPYNETQERFDFVYDGSSLLIGPLNFAPELANKTRWYADNLYVDKGTYSKTVAYTPRSVVLFDGSYYANIRPCKNVSPLVAYNWVAITIPAEYGPCDTIEVFAAGRRLRKDPHTLWFEDNGPYSPTADVTVEAEFSVDGVNYGTTQKPVGYIRLTDPLKPGTRITIIRRLGKTWYDNGTSTATSGVTLLDNATPISKFIAQKTTSLPE